MAKTKEPAKERKKSGTIGHISQVIGAVVDVVFPAGELPQIYEAIVVKDRSGREVVMEVEAEVGDNAVRCIAMDSTDGFRRGDEGGRTGPPSQGPVRAQPLVV